MALQSYKRAFKERVLLIARDILTTFVDAELEESLNNSLERLNGTVREREKVMRGF
jgi:hypothetical protein